MGQKTNSRNSEPKHGDDATYVFPDVAFSMLCVKMSVFATTRLALKMRFDLRREELD